MGFGDDLRSEVRKIFRTQWTRRDGLVVPNIADLKLGENDGVDLDAVVLYADLVASTDLVKGQKDAYAAEIYKTFLHCACQIIKTNNGVITSFDGDRVMGIFIGGSKRSDAAKTGLQINWAVKNIIKEENAAQYKEAAYAVASVVGIDTSKILAARTGVRGDNDIVWVGNAANRAAKLCSIRPANYPTYITKEVYDQLHESSKFSNGVNTWTALTWTVTGETIYGSTYGWPL